MFFMVVGVGSDFHDVCSAPYCNGAGLGQVSRAIVSLLAKIIRYRGLREGLFT